jgi:NADPH2:quinone reductase
MTPAAVERQGAAARRRSWPSRAHESTFHRMRYIAVRAPGGPDQLVLAEGLTPAPSAGEVLIRVAAAGVNRADILQREGKYPPPAGASPILGLEVAGTILGRGPDVGDWNVGDQVCALVTGGGYAEECVAPAPQCLPVPTGLSLVEAAALPEACFTVWTNLFQRGHLSAGETALIHGGASGIGTTAIQLAHALGARVFTTAGTAEKCAACTKLGADSAINYHAADFVAEVLRGTGGRGADVVLDMVGGDYVAFMQGSRVELDVYPIMRKRLTITGSTLRPRPVAEKGAIAREVRERVWPLIEAGRVRSVVDRVFPLAEAAAAHHRIESDEHIGKIVLEVSPTVR